MPAEPLARPPESSSTRSAADTPAPNPTSLELLGDREIVIRRTLNAPPAVVFDAWTRPELVRRWWAPASRGVSMLACEADVRPGGTYRYALGRGTEQMVFSGTYQEVVPPRWLVYTQLFEPMRSAGEVHVTVTFDGDDGRTHVTARERYPSTRVRDAVLATGMEQGMRETMDQLETLVATLHASAD